MTVAEVGNIVEFYDGLRGRVEKINDNSVMLIAGISYVFTKETLHLNDY